MSDDAPAFAREVINETVQMLPTGSTVTRAYIAVTFKAAIRAGGRVRNAEEVANDLAARLPAQASQLYGTNLVNLLKLLTPEKDGQLTLDWDDVVQRSVTVVRDGETTWPPPPVQVSAAPAAAAAAPVEHKAPKSPMSTGRRLGLTFAASALPPKMHGCQRQFFLYADGWDKDSDFHVATGTEVEPLPHHGMDAQRYVRKEARPAFPSDALHRTYNTRWVEGSMLRQTAQR